MLVSCGALKFIMCQTSISVSSLKNLSVWQINVAYWACYIGVGRADNWFSLKKGPNYAPKRVKPETDLTRDLLQRYSSENPYLLILPER